MCPYSELFRSIFLVIWTEYGEIRSISPSPVRMGENTEMNNSKYRHFSSNDDDSFHVWTFRLWFFKLWYWLTLININSELDVFAMILTLTTREMNYNTLLWFKDKTFKKYNFLKENMLWTLMTQFIPYKYLTLLSFYVKALF